MGMQSALNVIDLCLSKMHTPCVPTTDELSTLQAHVCLPQDTPILPQLHTLKVWDADMQHLPLALTSRLQSLVVLDLSQNNFVLIPSAVAQIPTLQELNLSGNKKLGLRRSDVEMLKSLKSLDLLHLDKGYRGGGEGTWSNSCMRVILLISKTIPDLTVKI